jgi:hypothetical protein
LDLLIVRLDMQASDSQSPSPLAASHTQHCTPAQSTAATTSINDGSASLTSAAQETGDADVDGTEATVSASDAAVDEAAEGV